jgi:M6 family metalloprotease-like protein
VRASFVWIAGLAALPLVAVPSPAAAQQSKFYPRWEIPGFDFRKVGGWRVRGQQVAALRRQLLAQGRLSALNAPTFGPSRSATQITGTIQVPVLLFSYQGIDSASFMRDTAQYQTLLFGAAPPGGNPYTLRTYYEQMSNGVFSMQGKIMGWVRLSGVENTYTGTPGTCNANPTGTSNCNGIFSVASTFSMQNGFREALTRVDTGAAGINFAQFDNDGPDEVPNSGDDDGYVDMIMFAHPTQDGACGGATNNHIWSHRFVLVNSSSTNFQDYVTNDASARGGGFGNIRISDYFATSALGGPDACNAAQVMPIGTAAHEFGHALGLPDLYDTQGPTEGIGRWGLMGAGNFSTPPSPSRMEAWSLNEMGWVTVVPITTAGTYSFGAAPVADTAFYVNVPGANPRGEYFLLENRQAQLADTALIANACRVWYQSASPPPCDGGLLVWHVDGAVLAGGGNALNAGAIHGLKLEEADGARDLWCPGAVPLGCNRGDAGDVFPGTTGNTAFSMGTNPAAVTNQDSSSAGFAIDSIRQLVPGGTMSFRLRFGSPTVVLATDTNAVVAVNGVSYNVFRNLFDDGSTPTVSVADTQFSADGRTRWSWVSWSDGLARSHIISAGLAGDTVIAILSRAFKVIATATAGGSVTSNPTINLAGQFIPEGNGVQLTAAAVSGASFIGWSGDTVSSNPVITLPMGRPYTVAANFVTTADVVTQLLGPGTPLSVAQQLALDAQGNNNGAFDIGDFLAWVKATGAPLTAEVMARLMQKKGGRP